VQDALDTQARVQNALDATMRVQHALTTTRKRAKKLAWSLARTRTRERQPQLPVMGRKSMSNLSAAALTVRKRSMACVQPSLVHG
jgi:hypothetical protein